MKKRSLFSRATAVILTLAVTYSLCATSVGAVTGTCISYKGSNKEAQDYQTWASPIYSYLTNTSDGNIMTVQYVDSENRVVATYYDSNYNFLREKKISQELPLFGGFYETASNYYIISGQENREQLPNVESFRIIKYDKNWNRIASTGLSDCNTTVPFDAGCVRVDECGEYLIIRTSHEMYKSNDGRNHQANVTIQLDAENMRITDSVTGVFWGGVGYVSHSFNQFVKVENNNIVAVDHGDAYPRSIVLSKYDTNLMAGSFFDYYGCCTPIDFIKFPGEIGNNYTGASVGGFEISSTDYIIAGSAVDYDSYVDYDWANQEKEIRNIFVSTIDKDTNRANTYYVTSYSDGEIDASTPHLVKTGDDTFMLLWTRDDTVYYTQLNRKGNCVGNINSIKGNLSDCVPVVVNNELKWYVWDNNIIDFYSINLDTQQASVTQIENGHQYNVISTGNGKATLECPVCGLVETVGIFTGIEVYSGTRTYTDQGSSFKGYSGMKREYSVGDRIDLLIRTTASEEFDECKDECVINISDPSIAELKTDSLGDNYINILRPGNVTITIGSKYDPTVSETYSIKAMLNGYELGDVNLDGKVDIQDVTYLQKYLAYMVSFTDDQRILADVSYDGTTAIDDATLIQIRLAEGM